MAQRLAGKEVVTDLAHDLRGRVETCIRAGVHPTLAIVRLGERPDDMSYERTATRRAEGLGVAIKPYVLDEFVPQAALLATIQSINYDRTVHGCLLFRPLPTFIDERAICDALDARKDVDGISLRSLASVFTDATQGYPPCTAEACVVMLDHYHIPIAGKHVVVVGRSLVIGKPVAMMLLHRNASVTICHSKTENLEAMCRSADIVICATGRARAFDRAYFRPGQTVLDVGINFDTQGHLCGDVDYEDVEPVVGAITPVPGGIGSVTTSVTMEHTVHAAERAIAAAAKDSSSRH
ncbi:MAG: bifunctional 5,10-methylene-tetrahydrofolate dehydrogenase/5,10-methylene-tetrahydrofolate cyclohydrolase [Eggerthellaceae bacterium]|jgi:methylenetetrahydrofolate dehydrogenase (NADP+)/methenyltetrahydrofolate cyclohydrolase|nr:bifunctional 5,10-methylene-tetrahydrofolate dehydrogenase/5,10-methylene-tetrahydrofolate cyclohydrolase [Eggerthellaceae bacterium]MCH4220844.1 bifunctional 5,10-methylene-tetrahydrofolate dehydrogenase/5,10-methylene-tetrahydrofolate cyclohydrolase [Eggerthellaceae bacterium]